MTSKDESEVYQGPYRKSSIRPTKDSGDKEDLDLLRSVQEFKALSREKQQEYVNIAKRKTKADTCFFCKIIVQKIWKDRINENARISHLMSCCSPDSDLNKERYGADKI